MEDDDDDFAATSSKNQKRPHGYRQSYLVMDDACNVKLAVALSASEVTATKKKAVKLSKYNMSSVLVSDEAVALLATRTSQLLQVIYDRLCDQTVRFPPPPSITAHPRMWGLAQAYPNDTDDD